MLHKIHAGKPLSSSPPIWAIARLRPIVAIFTALSYVMMSRAFPVAGSVYTYDAPKPDRKWPSAEDNAC